jgi:phospholipid/cholesterol/gamma-HCH transport system substrate-binding protein
MTAPANSTETLVGAAVLAVAAGFFLYATNVSGKGNSYGNGYRVTAEFDNADGINVGTDVRLAGIKVGTVVGQSLNAENYQAKIEMALDPKVGLAEDTSAKIASDGLLGARFVVLEPGGAEAKLANGSVIVNTQGAVDLWALISQAMFDRKGSGGSPMDGMQPPPDQPAADPAAEKP